MTDGDGAGDQAPLPVMPRHLPPLAWLPYISRAGYESSTKEDDKTCTGLKQQISSEGRGTKMSRGDQSRSRE
jgi:hypothetical protein